MVAIWSVIYSTNNCLIMSGGINRSSRQTPRNFRSSITLDESGVGLWCLCYKCDIKMAWSSWNSHGKIEEKMRQILWPWSDSIKTVSLLAGIWDRLLVDHRTRDRKVASSNPDRSGKRIFFSRFNFLCWLLFGVRSTPVLPRWHVKDPGHSTKSAGGRLRLNALTPLTKRSRSGPTIPLSRHSLGTYQETSSHATCQGTFDHSRLSSLGHCGLILA